MPSSPIVGVEYVVDLIILEMALWSINLVNELFPPNKAAMILATPLSCRFLFDKLIWYYDAKGFAVFRDEVGSYAGGFIRKISPASNPTMVEMLVVIQAIGNRVCYVHRTTNVAAYGMAKLAVSSSIDFCWHEEPLDLNMEALYDVS
ncbi:TMV resistance protein N-like [Pyrus ussuriensis x Pyrus communis]|uniref:TMV resistance protein N-like n=1 Tax=Pyrus ussuriensis x Pyrus communis TaxID=2448454 RepID=A0A5N5GKG1_9ROSA|nr:TMV resistance protein N-like [Pyrus ussuriensis x Pyrus communis]